MKTKFEEIVNASDIGSPFSSSPNTILNLAHSETVRHAVNDKEKSLLLAIDFQNDFMENGELGVTGSHLDILNTTKFIYNNFENLSQIVTSLDTHEPLQIFHPLWWKDSKGNHPEPFTIISYTDVINGKWIATNLQKESQSYIQQLEDEGKKQLCIWPYHCIDGSFGNALENQFSNMVNFHSIARRYDTIRLRKGYNPLSEMYGIIKPEIGSESSVDYKLLNLFANFDKIFVVGEAKSHCVLESLKQILSHYKDSPEITSNFIILQDCMSSITGFEDETESEFLKLREIYNIKLSQSTDIFF